MVDVRFTVVDVRFTVVDVRFAVVDVRFAVRYIELYGILGNNVPKRVKDKKILFFFIIKLLNWGKSHIFAIVRLYNLYF